MSVRLTDRELVAAYDRRDFNTLWTQGLLHVPAILRAMVRLGQLRDLTEDTLQQAALCVGETARRWRPIEGAFSTWISNGVTWRMREWARTQARLALPPVDGDDSPIDPDHLSYDEPPEGFAPPEAQAARDERSADVRAAVAGLRDQQERVVVGFIYGLNGPALTVRECADLLGEPVMTVMDRLERARDHLTVRLRKHSPRRDTE